MSASAIPNYRMSKTQTQGPSFPSTVIEIRRKRHRGLRLTLTMKAETAQGKRPEAQAQESSVNSRSKSLEEPITGVPLGKFSLCNQTSTKTQWTCTFTTTWDSFPLTTNKIIDILEMLTTVALRLARPGYPAEVAIQCGMKRGPEAIQTEICA
ncbi:hypothetical protein BDQ17DRAFT_1408590 [Cyathus striatus]|nr:hypothetical protein BDQ17DRAFT_1408590 [Cyathus striatus]